MTFVRLFIKQHWFIKIKLLDEFLYSGKYPITGDIECWKEHFWIFIIDPSEKTFAITITGV